MTAAALVLAHQGGWDEILLVTGPIAVIGGLLWLAKKRVETAAAPPTEEPPAPPPQRPSPPAPPAAG